MREANFRLRRNSLHTLLNGSDHLRAGVFHIVRANELTFLLKIFKPREFRFVGFRRAALLEIVHARGDTGVVLVVNDGRARYIAEWSVKLVRLRSPKRGLPYNNPSQATKIHWSTF